MSGTEKFDEPQLWRLIQDICSKTFEHFGTWIKNQVKTSSDEYICLITWGRFCSVFSFHFVLTVLIFKFRIAGSNYQPISLKRNSALNFIRKPLIKWNAQVLWNLKLIRLALTSCQRPYCPSVSRHHRCGTQHTYFNLITCTFCFHSYRLTECGKISSVIAYICSKLQLISIQHEHYIIFRAYKIENLFTLE